MKKENKELKTVKDLKHEVLVSYKVAGGSNHYITYGVTLEKLKAEAIEWVKALKVQDSDNKEKRFTAKDVEEIFKYHFGKFHNITEEDLK